MGLLLKHELVHCKIRIIFFADLYLFYALCIGLIRLFTDYQIILLKLNEMACDEKVLNRQLIKRHTMYAELILQIQEKELGLTTVYA